MSKKQTLIGRETIPVKSPTKTIVTIDFETRPAVEAKPVYVQPEEDRTPTTSLLWFNRQRRVKAGEIPRTNDDDGEPVFFYCQTISFQEYLAQLHANARDMQWRIIR